MIVEGGRKSIEPMANRIKSGNVQALQQFVNQSPWSFEDVQANLRKLSQTKLKPKKGVLILDDTSFPKKGKNSVGVSRQYCGALGKVANCQSVVSWHFANDEFHLPLISELYLPQSWTDDKDKLIRNGVPKRRFKFKKNWEIALDLFNEIKNYSQYEAVLCDAGYGEIPDFLNELDKKNIKFVAQIPERMSFWPEELKLVLPENITQKKVGRPNKHPKSLTPEIRPKKAKILVSKLL